MLIKKNTIGVFCISNLLLLIIFGYTQNILLAILFGFFSLIFISLCLNIKKNYFITIYLLAFFIFLLGRIMMTQIFGMSEKNYVPTVSTESFDVIYKVMIVSLVSLIVGYYMKNFTISGKVNYFKKLTNVSDDFVYALQGLSGKLFCVLQVIVIITNLERIIFNYAVGYFESYLSYSSRIPYAIRMLADVEPVVVAAYLATMPSKKKLTIPACFYIAAILTYAIGGRRYQLVSSILLVIVYAAMRNDTDNKKWLSKRMVLIGIIIFPLFLILLQAMSSWRLGHSMSVSNPIGEFLYSVGGSGYITGYANMCKNVLRERGVWFSTGRIWKYICANPISKMIFNTPVYKNQTVDNALYGRALGDAITYYMRESSFVSGYGMGSSYVAELFVDFSYFGVAFGNYIIGRILKKTRGLKKNNILNNFVTIFIITLLLRIPRDSFDYLFIDFIGIKNIICMILLYCITVSKVKRGKGRVKYI